MSEMDIDSLVADAGTGDREATARLLVHFGPQLTRRIEAKMQQNRFPEISPDDVLQEVYVDVFKGIASFDPDRGVPLIAWLNTVADNRFFQIMRDRGRKKRGGNVWRVDGEKSSVIRLISELGEDEVDTPSVIAAGKEATQAVEVCVAALPQHQRDVIEQYYLEGKGLDELADDIGTSKDALRGLLYRARKSIRSMMGNSSVWFTKK